VVWAKSQVMQAWRYGCGYSETNGHVRKNSNNAPQRNYWLKFPNLFMNTLETGTHVQWNLGSWRPFVTWNVRKLKLLWSHGVLFNSILKKPQNNEIQEKAWEFRAKVTQQLTLSCRYSQLVANHCCWLVCSLLETPSITRHVFGSENVFVNWFVCDESCSWTKVPLYFPQWYMGDRD
jgi:hypothetical protein